MKLQRSRRSLWYGAAGAVLALGAPTGLLLLREFVSPSPVTAELAAERLTYVYLLVATSIVFAVFGFIVGGQADRLAELSQTDMLTGLANRRALSLQLEREIRRSVRYGTPASLMLIDVDGLKQINDREGHSAGDRVIRHVANAITEVLRDTDFGARWGGDEFAIVAPNATAEAAFHSAERLVVQLATDSRRNGGMTTTISVGIATFDPGQAPACTVEQLLHAADDALYRAKSTGRNRVQAA
jgi:diguanylate cyclase (GGDEF)-like protein